MLEFKHLEEYRRRCIKAIASVRDIDMIERIIPLAFPVYKSEWKIRLRVEKTTGLVDRHILTAVKRFGPVSAAEIGVLMGLQAEMVESSLSELSRVGVALRHDANAWSLPEDAEIQHFYVEQDHSFCFVSNGITGDFLPLVQTKCLNPVTLDKENIRRLRLVSMSHVRSSSEGELMKEVQLSSRAHRFVGYGIPDGFLGFAGEKPEKEFANFVLAYIVEFKGGEFEIVSASESAFRFDCPKTIVERCLKSGNRVKTRPVEFDGVSCRDYGNARLLTVKDDDLWTGELEGNDARDDAIRLLRRMTHPGWSCDGDGTFHRLLPGDVRTAHRLAVMRGCSLLRRSYAQIRNDQDIRLIADKFRDECITEFPAMKKIPAFAEVLNEAAESQDGNVAEIARRFLPKVSACKDEGDSTVRFLHSRGRSFHEAVVAAINSAKTSILIMCPVLDENGVFDALQSARARGVREIYVVTQLSGHRNNVFKTDPQFADYELPRRKLAALGVGVRDCKHTVHGKMLVVDSSWMFVTSANLNANGLGVGRANSTEVAIEFRDRLVAKAGESLFWEVWYSSCYRQVRTDDRISIITNEMAREVKIENCVQKCRGCTFLLSTPENQLLVRKVCAMLASAREKADILSMSFYDLMEVPGLFDEMRRALKRGVRIRVCVRPGEEMNFTSEQWPDPSTVRLLKDGLKLYLRDHLHAKGIVVDGREAMITSANFNQFSFGCSRTSHIELAVIGSTELKQFGNFAAFVKDCMTRAVAAS